MSIKPLNKECAVLWIKLYQVFVETWFKKSDLFDNIFSRIFIGVVRICNFKASHKHRKAGTKQPRVGHFCVGEMGHSLHMIIF